MTKEGSDKNAAGFRVSRRHLLIGGAGVIAAGATGIGASFFASTPANIVTNIVRNHLPGLQMADGELRRFADEFLAADRQTSRVEMTGMRVLAPFVNLTPIRWMVPAFVARGIDNFERRVMHEFMMATDFFQTYAVGQKTVTYYEIYSVYGAPCANPLPKFNADEDAA